MNMKTLNLDEFAQDKRVIILKGVEHEVREMSVEDFITASVDAKKLEAEGGLEKGVAENVDGTVTHLRRAIPTLEVAQLKALSIAQLVVLVQFVNGSLQAESVKGEEAAGNSAGA